MIRSRWWRHDPVVPPSKGYSSLPGPVAEPIRVKPEPKRERRATKQVKPAPEGQLDLFGSKVGR